MKTNFTKIYTPIFSLNVSNLSKLLLSFIIGHNENNQDFIYTDEQLSITFNCSTDKIRRSLTQLKKNNYILSSSTKQYFNDDKKWGNRRVITITDKTISIINGEKIIEDVQSNIENKAVETIKIIQPIEDTKVEEKVQQIEDNGIIEDIDNTFNFDSEEIDDLDNEIDINNYSDSDKFIVQLENGLIVHIVDDVMINYYEYIKNEKIKTYRELINCEKPSTFMYVLNRSFESDYMYQIKNNLQIQ